MKPFLALILTFLLPLVLINCNDNDNVTDSGNSGSNLVCVQVDLLMGFENKFVFVSFNDTRYFSAFINNYGPLAGPQASFTTYLTRGTNRCKVHLSDIIIYESYKTDSTTVYFGNLEKYYMVVFFHTDSLLVMIQDTPFTYAKVTPRNAPRYLTHSSF